MSINNSDELSKAPILLEIFRGEDDDSKPIIECVHRGLIAAVTGDGKMFYAKGNVSILTHMRSCAKPFQILPLLEMKLFDEKSLNDSDILKFSDLALLMSSHAGQDIHIRRVKEIIDTIGLMVSDLRCGAHMPLDEIARCRLISSQESPTNLHNNCSGKHTAMLIACLKKGFSIQNYEDIKHPLQQWIKSFIKKVSGLPENKIYHGIDGCSLPSFAIPLENIALMYARLAYWQTHLPTNEPAWLKHACKKIWQAANLFPEHIAGNNKFDSEMIKSGASNFFSKTGADGLQALAILPNKIFPTGLGIVIKIIDGDHMQNIRPLVLKRLLENFGLWPNDKKLDQFLRTFKNFRGQITGGALYQIK
jgi:L-asparaginase II